MEETKERAKWEEGKYNFSYLRLGNGFTITVGWAPSGGGYEVSFCGLTLKAKFEDAPTAKQAGEQLARKVLTSALYKLPVQQVSGVPKNVLAFNTPENAKLFLEMWEGHPWYVVPNGTYEIVPIVPLYEKITGYRRVK